MIRFAIEKRRHTYSFGRSTADNGIHEYKRRWGTTDTVVYWNYDQPQGGGIRDAGFLQKVWRLLPLSLANFLGPYIVKRIY